MLEINNIYVDFDRPILNNISFKAKQGQIIGLVGKSGASPIWACKTAKVPKPEIKQTNSYKIL